MNKTVDQLAQEKGVKVYDTALPQDWVDDFYKKMGVYPAACGMFVWTYDKPTSMFGSAFPLTEEAEKLLREYNKMMGYTSPWIKE